MTETTTHTDAHTDAAAPDKSEAARFLSLLDPAATRHTFQTFDDVKDREPPRKAHIYHGTLDQYFAVLAAINNQGSGVFITVNATDFLGRKIPNIVKVRSLFVDLDGAPLEPVLESNPPRTRSGAPILKGYASPWTPNRGTSSLVAGPGNLFPWE